MILQQDLQLGLSIWELHASPDERHQMRFIEPAPLFLSRQHRLKTIAIPVFRDPALLDFFFRGLTGAAAFNSSRKWRNSCTYCSAFSYRVAKIVRRVPCRSSSCNDSEISGDVLPHDKKIPKSIR